ncbi:zinc-binding dehydrogenase [Actinomyces sp.]|uniref:zinc-binding dehydrogenase n=1 Tax=Actinomyces sp. TaxID=29317 RepID=UPI002910559E|nr:zinc-binding dehydrogenase [Actinomyces sp.]MDU5231318.1 zinc-binding dehydrogenase [Actinomyces sp.]MDU6756818.1 zinc-binding dehydrogenase [Actinomyces sp.]
MRAIISAADQPRFANAASEAKLSDRLSLIHIEPPSPAPNQVRIKVLTTAVNPADVLQSKGAYPSPRGASRVLGLECAGIIDQVGAEATSLPGCSWIHEGVAACALLEGGGYADYAVVDARQVLPIPKLPASTTATIRAELNQANANPDMQESSHRAPASAPDLGALVATMGLVESAATSWMILENIGKLASNPGRSVLIHGASGGVGSIAVQLANSMGNTVYATAGTPERCERVQDLGASKCFDYHDAWLEQLKKLQPSGVDVIMDVLGAGGLSTNLKALARYGHLAVLGLLQGAKAELNLGYLLAKNASITAQTLRSQTPKRKIEILQQLREHVWPAVEVGQIKPVIGATYPLEEIAAAHKAIAGRGDSTFGKIVITL